MELEDFRLLYNVWFNSRQDHHLDFPDWLYGAGYNVESVLQYEDEASQQAWLEKEIGKVKDGFTKFRKLNGSMSDGI